MILLALVFAALTPLRTDACSTFIIPQSPEKLMGKSYDWHHNDGMALVNKRGLAKVALALSPDAKPARWVSRFGSLTFNQHGREFPISGINEAGLAVEIMWLTEAATQPPDGRPEINEVQWVQYQLDNYGTVGEVIADIDRVRVAKTFVPIHYLACDATGACAAIDFIGGRAVVHTGPDVIAFTNDTYAQSARYRADFTGFGGAKPIPTGSDSLGRFVRASSLARDYHPGLVSPTDYAFNVLREVRQATSQFSSQWNIVYSLAKRRVDFKLVGGEGAMTFNLSSFDFSCSPETKALLLRGGLNGDVSGSFGDYTRELNERVLTRGLQGASISLPEALRRQIAAYPDSFKCAVSVTLAPPAFE